MPPPLLPNPGLSADFNRYLAHLDALLPRRSRKGDRAAQLLQGALSQLHDVHANVWSTLNSFLIECEAFRRRQFWVDPDFMNRDAGACWLPIVVAGHAWSTCLQSIARIRLPDSVGRARRVVLKPIAPGLPQSIRVVLRRNVAGVGEAAYERFACQVKPLAPHLESVYDADNGQLDIHHGNEVEVSLEAPDSPHSPVNGGVPAWLENLLEMNAVEQLDLRYPLVQREVPTLAGCISVFCVIPDCPVDWRTKGKFPPQAVFQSIADSLGQGADQPFHLHVTAVEDEWLPLADAFVARTALAADDASPETADTEDFLLRHVSRYMTLHPSLQMRDDSEYENLRLAYHRAADGGHVLTPAPAIATVPEDAAASILGRLNDAHYITAWANYFKGRARQAAAALASVAVDEPSSSGKLARGDKSEYQVRVASSIRDFTACILASIETSLDVLVSTESQIHERRAARIGFQRLCVDATDPDLTSTDPGEAEAMREIIRLTLSAPQTKDRARALAALVYALTEQDVISDSETYGRVDDRFVIATVLTEESFSHLASQVAGKWCRAIRDRIDGMAARPAQNDVLARFARLVQHLESLCDAAEASMAESPAKKPRTGK